MKTKDYIKKLKNMDNAKLQVEVENTSKEINKLRLEISGRKTTSFNKYKDSKKNLARIYSVLADKQGDSNV